MRVMRLERLAKRRCEAESNAWIDANLDRWCAEAVGDTTPLDQMESINARITELLRELAGVSV